jgi:Mg2+ and Co2+ transporter CorA
MRPHLKLKPMDFGNASTERIYALVEETVKNFNIYVADFYESVAILEEQLKAAKNRGGDCSEIEGKISYMRTRIEELSSAMKGIADEMHALVELHHPS